MLLLIVLWIAWCVLHSLLITTAVRQWFEGKGGAWLGLYRLGYVGFSLATLAPLLWYSQMLPQRQLAALPLWAQALPVLLFVYALALFVGGARVYDLHSFLGLAQWRAYQTGRTPGPPAFRQTGILRHVRHPWYGGGIALLWAMPDLTAVSLAIRTILTAYLILGALLEERKLKAEFGQTYQDYCRRTPMLFPWKFRPWART